MRRLFGIRHLRYLWHSYHLARWVGLWARHGYVHASAADLQYLGDVWEGKRSTTPP